jgi:5,5'-dehydrodivanillate O-demethylase
MLTREENEMLSRVGRETPCGELMRRYWHPIAATVELLQNPVRKVKVLGEQLVLYRDRKGKLGLIGPRCGHRLMHLEFGIPEQNGLRCPYHGWLFDREGRCLEQPLEPPESTLKHRIKIPAYPVQEMGGLIWAYLGPEPTPLLPRWDLFVREDGFRQIIGHWLPCNWLQVMENRGDLGHVVYLHGRLFQYALERQGRLTDDPNRRFNATMREQQEDLRRGVYTKYRPIYNQYGFTKGTLRSDESEDAPSWNVGMNPILFPYILHSGHRERVRQVYQIGVPIDDTTTWHISYHCYVFPPEVAVAGQEVIPYADVPLKNENGEYILDYVLGQDMVAWYAQGELTDRTEEHLATADECVVAYRRLLKEQIEIVMRGGEPMNVFRDPKRNLRLTPPVPAEGQVRSRGQYYRTAYHKTGGGGWSYMDDDVDRYCPDRDLLKELYRQTEEVMKKRG